MRHAAATNAAAHPSRRVRARVRAAACALAKWRLALVALLLFAFAQGASAQVNIYQLRGLSDYGIYVYNVPANTNTTVYKPYPVTTPGSTNSATLAQRPTDGMLFYVTYVQNVNNQVLYRFNPATPNIAPVPVGTGLGPAVPSSLRMAFSPSGTLYYLPDTRILYTIDTTTGVAASTGITVGAAIGSGGDMAFNSAGTLYVVTSAKTLYTVSLVNGTATQVGNAAINFVNENPQPNATIGLAFDSTGRLLAQTQSPNELYSVTLPVAANATPQANFVRNGDGDIGSTGDMASANVPAPNLSITKTDGVTNVYRGGPVTYTIVVTNSSAYPVTGTLTDNVPASVTGVAWTCAASAGSTCNTVSGSGNAISTTATLAVNGTATYTVTGTISATASGTISNQATVLPPAWLVDSSPANNTATDNSTVDLNANLGITKTDNATNVTPGATVTYAVVVSNAGPDPANGALVTDTVPAALTGVSWTCGTLVGGATCGAASGSGNTISTTANLPSGGSVTYTVTGTLATTATGTLTNTARVLTPASGVTDPNDPTRTGAGNNTATDNSTINTVPNLGIAKTHTGNFTVGVNGTYTLTASNTGNGATSGTITVTDDLPTGLTVAAVPSIANWDCSATVVGSSTMTCTSATVIPAGASHPNAITLNVVVSAAAFAASPVTNVANISGGGEPAFNNGNNSASDPTTINGAPDLSVTKTHTGNFTRGQQSVAYNITVTNSGTAPTNATNVTVTDTLPAGLTPTGPTGLVNGWTCGIAGQVIICTRTSVLNPGASYPVITVLADVSQTAANSVTNSVTVSGGGDNNAANNTATDPTNIISRADLSLTKTADNAAPLVNQNVTFTLTVSNAGPTNTSGVTVRDLLPAGLSFVSATPSAAYNSATGVWTVGALNSGANTVLTIVAKVTTSGAITNTAEVTASAVTDPDSTPNNNNAAEDDQASVVLGVPVPPDVRLQKRCTSPANCESAAQQPGTELTYTITFTNTAGTSAAQGLTIVDIIPFSVNVPSAVIVKSTEFKVGSMTFSPGTTGLTIAPTGYKSYNDAINYPAPLPPWNPASSYTPVGTFDPNVTYVAWQLTGNMPPGTSGSVTFTVRIR